MSRPSRLASTVWLLLSLTVLLSATARAQPSLLTQVAGGGKPISRNEPVTFTADQVEYDKHNNLVIARGHVEAWQNDHVMQADEVTFDRNTGVAAAKGHVVLLEPDGQVLFADYAEMTQNMQTGVLKDMSALLAENGKLVANGARRTDGVINEMSKVVYSTCNLCKDDPSKPPLWQIKADSAIQDLEHKTIEFENATMEMYGIPIAYFPFLSQPDPSVKRKSGLLVPWFGSSSHIGGFFSQPYYWVIDDQSDATFTPMMTTRSGPQLDVEYRRRFNNGYLLLNGSTGYLDHSLQGSIVAKGEFSYDDTWRWGFDINRASTSNYIRDFHLGSGLGGDPDLLTSQIYVEGFGQGAYSRLDTRFYQGVNGTITNTRLPLVLPRYEYSYMGRPDDWGGRLSVDADAFNIYRSDGTSTRRAHLGASWERPWTGALGDLWKLTLHIDAVGYNASHFNDQPNYGPKGSVNTGYALPQLAVDARWPFYRDSGSWGTQLIEPIAEVIVAPQMGDSQWSRWPDEDSLDFQFTDQNLFGFNRFPGVDRQEGGIRANLAMHGAWYLGGTTLDAMIGQSYRTNKSNLFPEASGLHDQVSDIVAHTSFSPTKWLDLTWHGRFDHRNFALRYADAIATVGVPLFRVSGGYIYSAYNPYAFYDLTVPPPATSSYYFPRNEVSLNVSSQIGAYRLTGFARRDVANNRMVAYGADAIYEDECFILDLRYFRRETTVNDDHGSTTILFLFTFKTIGQFGYRAL